MLNFTPAGQNYVSAYRQISAKHLNGHFEVSLNRLRLRVFGLLKTRRLLSETANFDLTCLREGVDFAGMLAGDTSQTIFFSK